mgnify:CR=1 FL=1
MKTKIYLLCVVIFLSFLSVGIANAEEDNEIVHASDLTGTANSYLNEISELPGKIDELLCEGNKEEYRKTLQELATAISNATVTIQDMGKEIPSGLWNVYSIITANPACGIGARATGAADLAREKWNLIVRDYAQDDE